MKPTEIRAGRGSWGRAPRGGMVTTTRYFRIGGGVFHPVGILGGALIILGVCLLFPGIILTATSQGSAFYGHVMIDAGKRNVGIGLLVVGFVTMIGGIFVVYWSKRNIDGSMHSNHAGVMTLSHSQAAVMSGPYPSVHTPTSSYIHTVSATYPNPEGYCNTGGEYTFSPSAEKPATSPEQRACEPPQEPDYRPAGPPSQYYSSHYTYKHYSEK